MDRIRTVEEVERDAQRQIEILERRFALIEAYRDNLITGGELEDALLLLSLAFPLRGGEGGNGDL